jgi:hypothetical protein
MATGFANDFDRWSFIVMIVHIVTYMLVVTLSMAAENRQSYLPLYDIPDWMQYLQCFTTGIIQIVFVEQLIQLNNN